MFHYFLSANLRQQTQLLEVRYLITNILFATLI